MVPTTGPTTRPFAITSDPAGQLWPQAVNTCDDCGPGWTWCLREDGAWEYERTNPTGYINGRITLRFQTDRTEISWSRYSVAAWQISTFSINQTDRESTVDFVVRTPAGMADWPYRITARHTADLMSDPALRAMLDAVLSELGAGPYDDGEYVAAVRSGARVSGKITARIDDELTRLRSSKWSERDKAEQAIRDAGWCGAVYLRQIDQSKLSIEQRRAVNCLLAEWPTIVVGPTN